DSSERLKQSPHLEVLHQRGFEVLLLTDPVDPWAVAGLGEYEGLPFVAASDADLKLDSSATDKAESTVREGELKALIERMRQRLQDHISEVKLSTRLTDSPLCLVVPEGALPPHMERLLRAAQQSLPTAKRILEINPGHPLITNLERLLGQSEHDARVDAWIDLLYQQALLAEGASVDNPAAFARQVTELLQEVTAQLAA
ncbi:MAG: molecular chaperone HtpG, partial [Polyangiales bacterium]